MSNFADIFRGKRITVMGLGLLGRGVGDAEFLAQCGAHVTVTDMKGREELSESVSKLSMYEITFHLGGHVEGDFTDTDMVIKAAGVPLNSPFIEVAKKAGVPIYMSGALFAKFAIETGATLIGVTGTRGKSTIAHLMHHALAHAQRPAKFGGNIRGVSTLALLPEIKKGDIAVLELDSWQLQGFGDLSISPHIAIFSNLMPDHLNYYPDMEAYFNDKANIFKNQKPGDFLFVGESVLERVMAANPPVAPIIPGALPEGWKILIPGEHNRRNVSLAIAALRAAGLSEQEIKRGVESFHGVEGRLQLVREIGGAKIYNDNNATTPEATCAALASFPVGKIVLIMGGSDKGLTLESLVKQIKSSTKKVILIPGAGSDKIKALIEADETPSLEAALSRALKASAFGDIILFSPGFASFGMFKNEYERNDEFLAIVRSIK